MEKWINNEVNKDSKLSTVKRNPGALIGQKSINNLIVDLDLIIDRSAKETYGYTTGDKTTTTNRLIKQSNIDRKLSADELLNEHVLNTLRFVSEMVDITAVREKLILLSNGSIPDGGIWKKRQEWYNYTYIKINPKIVKDDVYMFDPINVAPGSSYMVRFYQLMNQYFEEILNPDIPDPKPDFKINAEIRNILEYVRPGQAEVDQTRRFFNGKFNKNFSARLDKWYQKIAIFIESSDRVDDELRKNLMLDLDQIKIDIFVNVRDRNLRLSELRRNPFPPIVTISNYLIPGKVSTKIINSLQDVNGITLIFSYDQNTLLNLLFYSFQNVFFQLSDKTIISIENFKKMITRKLSHAGGQLKKINERMVSDFVLMTYFLGNDFLRRVPSFQYFDIMIEFLISKYSQPLTIKKDEMYVIDWKKFSGFLDIVSQSEDRLLSELNVRAYKDGFSELTENKNGDVDYDQFRDAWYGNFSNDIISSMATNQLDMFEWLHAYYQGRQSNMGFTYNYSFSSLLVDLYQASKDYVSLEHPKNDYTSIFSQIIALIPRRSSENRKKMLLKDTYEASNTKIGKEIMVEKYAIFKGNALGNEDFLKIFYNEDINYDFLNSLFEPDNGEVFFSEREIDEDEVIDFEIEKSVQNFEIVADMLEGLPDSPFTLWKDRYPLL